MTSEIETTNIEKLKAEIFDLIRQGEYIINLKSQKIQELNVLEDNMRKASVSNMKPVEKTEKIVQ